MNTMLSDHRGKISTTRVGCLICTIAACASVILPLFGYGSTPDFPIIAALLGGGFSAKVLGAGVEQKERAAN